MHYVFVREVGGFVKPLVSRGEPAATARARAMHALRERGFGSSQEVSTPTYYNIQHSNTTDEDPADDIAVQAWVEAGAWARGAGGAVAHEGT